MQKTFFAFVLTSFAMVGCEQVQNPEQICTDNQGAWLAEYQECEYLAKDVCEANGGVFKECESACRNDAETQMCTMQCVLVCDFGKENTPEKIKLDTKNTSYLIDGEKITLINGHSETEIFPGAASKNITDIFSDDKKGDFDGNGFEDTAVILTQNNGGSGTFFYIAVFNGKKGSNTILLNDRIAPQSIEFKNGEIIANYADRFPWESFADSPTLAKSKYLKYENGQLTNIQKFPKLSSTEAKKLAIAKWGNCKDCQSITVKLLDGRDHAWFVEAVYDGLKDDSLQAQKYVSMAHYVNGKWFLADAMVKAFKCREGRGQIEFGKTLCK